MENIIPSLSNILLKVLNLEQSLFSCMKTVVAILSPKEEKLMKKLVFAEAEIENFVCMELPV